MSEPNPKRAFSPKEFQHAFGISHTPFYAIVKRSEIAVRKKRRRTLIMAEEVERWQQSLPQGVASLSWLPQNSGRDHESPG